MFLELKCVRDLIRCLPKLFFPAKRERFLKIAFAGKPNVCKRETEALLRNHWMWGIFGTAKEKSLCSTRRHGNWCRYTAAQHFEREEAQGKQNKTGQMTGLSKILQ